MWLHLASLTCAAFMLLGCGDPPSPPAISDDERLALPPDPALGQRLFRACAACHNAQPSAGHRVGPNLWGVVGAPAGRHPDFQYSRALLRADLVWDEATLDAYLTNPRAVIPEGRMAYDGEASAANRRDIIAHLKTMK